MNSLKKLFIALTILGIGFAASSTVSAAALTNPTANHASVKKGDKGGKGHHHKGHKGGKKGGADKGGK